MEDKLFLYSFVFHTDYFILGNYFKKGSRFNEIEIISAPTHEHAKNEILSIVDGLCFDLYTEGVLELRIAEIQLFNSKSFYYKGVEKNT